MFISTPLYIFLCFFVFATFAYIVKDARTAERLHEETERQIDEAINLVS